MDASEVSKKAPRSERTCENKAKEGGRKGIVGGQGEIVGAIEKECVVFHRAITSFVKRQLLGFRKQSAVQRRTTNNKFRRVRVAVPKESTAQADAAAE